MIIAEEKDFLRKIVKDYKARGCTIGFVPTMGYLHEGHLQLVKKSKEIADITIVSIFVNPIQFGPGEDFAKYPRDIERDKGLLKKENVDVLFFPDDKEMYPELPKVRLIVNDLADTLCGKYRPGHFEGVLTVVAKLFNIVQPDFAFFGKKDAQQLIIIERMVRDLDFPIKIIAVDTVREEDGLAKSSRNTYLSDAERKIAPYLYKGLKKFVDELANTNDVIKLKVEVMKYLEDKGFKVQYLDLVDRNTLKEVQQLKDGKYMIAVAAFLGNTRLIDNIWFDVKNGRVKVL